MKGLNISLPESPTVSEDSQLLHSRIERLLFTGSEQRPGRLEFGSLIPKLFYEPSDPDLIADIIREVQYLITTYESQLILDSISAETVQQSDFIGLLIKISFFNITDQKPGTLEFFKVRSL